MDNNVLSHGGPGSGRYPKGSGDRPYQRTSKEFTRHRSIFKKKQRKSKEDPQVDKITTVQKATRKPVSQMSNEELKYYTDRINAELNFKEAVAKARVPTAKEKISKAVVDSIGKAGKSALDDITKSASTYAAKKVLEKAGFSVSEKEKTKNN